MSRTTIRKANQPSRTDVLRAQAELTAKAAKQLKQDFEHRERLRKRRVREAKKREGNHQGLPEKTPEKPIVRLLMGRKAEAKQKAKEQHELQAFKRLGTKS